MLYKDAVIIGVWTELALWLVFAALYIVCIDVLVRRRGTGSIQWIPMLTVSLLFGLSIVHLGIQLRRLYVGLVEHAQTHGGPAEYFQDIKRRLNLTANGVYAAMLIIGDAVVIHRCFLIWGKRLKVIILPALLLLGTAAMGYTSIWLLTKLRPRGTAFDGSIARCTRATFFLSLATNIVTTSLTAYRILATARKVSGSVDVRPYLGGLAIIVESAAIYTTALVAYLIIFLMKSNIQYIVFCALCPLIGIVPTLIIVRVGLGLTCASQADIEDPPAAFQPPTYYITPASSTAPVFPTPPIPSYHSSWSRLIQTQQISSSPEELDIVHLQLRYSDGSTSRGVTSDDVSKHSLTSLGLEATKTTDTK